MEMKLRSYINRKFFMYPKTKEIVELREELYSMMVDKYNDYQKNGFTKEESYKEALSLLEDYKSAIKEVETGNSLTVLKKKLSSSLSFSVFYFITLTCIYLYVSMVALNSFRNTWLVVVGGAFVYLIYFAANMLGYAYMFDMRVLTRCFVGVLFLNCIPLLYVFPSLLLSELYRKPVWRYSWLVLPVIAFIYLLTDLIIFAKNAPKLALNIHILVTGFALTTVVYLILSCLGHLWNIAWILYVVYLAIIALGFYVREKLKLGER